MIHYKTDKNRKNGETTRTIVLVDARFSVDQLDCTNMHQAVRELVEPMIYLSEQQEDTAAFEHIRGFAPITLPQWVPARTIAECLGFSDDGIARATAYLDGKPYLWATEFENVHTTWSYDEPEITVDGKSYPNSEAYYHSQKPSTFVHQTWERDKDLVMWKAIVAKCEANPSVKSLLLSTGDHPLLSLKPDEYWGFDSRHGGQNRLASLWMQLRHVLQQTAVEAPQGCAKRARTHTGI